VVPVGNVSEANDMTVIEPGIGRGGHDDRMRSYRRLDWDHHRDAVKDQRDAPSDSCWHRRRTSRR
jgi:hypothetical protein